MILKKTKTAKFYGLTINTNFRINHFCSHIGAIGDVSDFRFPGLWDFYEGYYVRLGNIKFTLGHSIIKC